jgi:preprotein translocase subunit SecG
MATLLCLSLILALPGYPVRIRRRRSLAVASQYAGIRLLKLNLLSWQNDCRKNLPREGGELEFRDFIYIAQILIAVLLTLVLLLQSKGSGVGTALGGGTGGSFRTRRGVEKSLFQLTIVLAIVFLAVSIVAVRQTV